MIGLGCMRLSTEHERDDERSIQVVCAALDAGATLLDTADAYCWDDTETGHNERLIARALRCWAGDRTKVVVATKGGLTRPGGEWIPDGRARHLAAACEASCRALDVACLDLYQLHAPDPRVPFATSVRALAALKHNGLVRRVGLCNVTIGQLEEARRSVDVEAVQVELNPWNDDNVLSGVVPYCVRNGIQVIAARPLGGAARSRRIASDPLLTTLADRYGRSPYAIVLAWIMDLPGAIVPLPGATRVENATSFARATDVPFTAADRGLLDARFFDARSDIASRPSASAVASRGRLPPDGEVILIMGLPGAGKSRLACQFVEEGYVRLNRDTTGGRLKDLAATLRTSIDSGGSRIVLDNTYVSRKARALVVRAVAPTGLPVRCVWLQTSLEDAQVNAVQRMLAAYGRLLEPDEMRAAVKHDVSAFGPSVQFRYEKQFEPPASDEGFSRIDAIPFLRNQDPSRTERALIVWCDGVMSDHPERDDALRRYAADGWRLLGLGWHDGAADDVYAGLRARIGADIDIRYCSHGGGPPVCWCRKPLPGLGVVFIERYKLNPAACIYVGGGRHDPGYARRLGFQYRHESDFFAC